LQTIARAENTKPAHAQSRPNAEQLASRLQGDRKRLRRARVIPATTPQRGLHMAHSLSIRPRIRPLMNALLPVLTNILLAVLVVSGILAQANAAQAQEWPSKPVRILVGFGRGGGTDIVARIIAPALSEALGQSVVVENVPGAGGTTAAGVVAKSPNDGYTAFLMNSGHAVSAAMYKSLPYDSVKDFQPVMLVASSSLAVVVSKSFPANDIKGLIEMARKAPGKLSFGSVGVGSAQHFAGELLRQQGGIDIKHVPYHDTTEEFTALRTNEVQIVCELVQAVRGPVQSGELKVLGVTAPVRWPSMPDVPTLGEQGIAGYDVTSWYGLVFPAGTPKPIVEKMSKALNELLRRESVRKAIADAGALAQPTTTDEFGKFIGSEIAKWRRVRDRAGIAPQSG
jgi:tripartite-type tricarboxylate transporter receptor subunit TctC